MIQVYFVQELNGNMDLYIINNSLSLMCWQPCKAQNKLYSLAMIVSKVYIILYTIYQFVYIYWLYKFMYVRKVQKQNTYSEGMALKCCMWDWMCAVMYVCINLWSSNCVCVCVEAC